MARIPYIVGDSTFETKDALKRHVQSLLAHYKPGERLDMFDEAFMADLLERHPNAEEKTGTGIAAISVERMRVEANGRSFFTTGFVVERTDGSRVDFSYNQCIRPWTHASKVKFAMRRAIAEQVIAAKALIFPTYNTTTHCPITGEPMTYNDSHVDHEPPRTFAALLEQYMTERGLVFDNIPLYESSTGIGKMLDPILATDWAGWHQQHAVLRVISAYANLHLVK